MGSGDTTSRAPPYSRLGWQTPPPNDYHRTQEGRVNLLSAVVFR